MSTAILLPRLCILIVVSLVACDISDLVLENLNPKQDLPQIRASWTDTASSRYSVKIEQETSLTATQLFTKDVHTSNKSNIFKDLEFSAAYTVEVHRIDSNGNIVGNDVLSKRIATAEAPTPVVSDSKIHVLLVFVSGAAYNELLVMEVSESDNKSNLKHPSNSTAYVALYVSAAGTTGRRFEIVEVGGNETSGPQNRYRNKPLSRDVRYTFSQRFFRGGSSVYFPWSDIVTIPTPVKVNTDMTSTEIVAVIVGVTAAIIGLVFIIICCFNWKYSLRYKPQPAKGKPANPIQRLITDPAIPVTEEDFYDHVCQMKLHNFKGFYEEFSSRKNEFQCSEAFRHPDNYGKNRYVNVPCFDHSRVELEGEDEVETYIHANYIPGAYDDKEYIYTQSPLPETIGDFWAMVWQQDSNIIVMIGGLIEKGKQDCASYFPDELDAAIKSYCLVTLTYVHNTTDYVIRTLVLSKDGMEKEVTHYQYIGWPTHKMTPEYSSSFLQMILRISRTICHRPGKPIVVHGTNDRHGRAGIYVCIDAEIQRFLKQGDLSVFGTVMACKRDRHDGVKTLDEYIFIHDTVLEAVLLKSIDNICVSALPKYIDSASKGQEGKDLFVTEFDFLTSTTMSSTQKMAAASQLYNIPKNRYANVKPYDYNRVKLTKLMNEEGSDYINASYIDTYTSKRKFIAAQAPLVDTISDFWRMINENESWVIIMLGQEIENGQLKANRFWPEEGYAMTLGEVTIKFLTIQRDAIPDVWIRQMELLNKEGERKLIQFYQYHSWPSHEAINSQSIRSLVQLVNQSQSWLHKLEAKRITVVSSSGIGRPGVFIGLRSLQEEADTEGNVNVFRTVQKLNHQRPNLVQSREQYALIYTSTLEMTENARRRPVIHEERSFDRCGSILGIPMDPCGKPVRGDAVVDMEPSEHAHEHDTGPVQPVDVPVDEPVKTDKPKARVPRVGFQIDGESTEKPSISRVNSGTSDSHF